MKMKATLVVRVSRYKCFCIKESNSQGKERVHKE